MEEKYFLLFILKIRLIIFFFIHLSHTIIFLLFISSFKFITYLYLYSYTIISPINIYPHNTYYNYSPNSFLAKERAKKKKTIKWWKFTLPLNLLKNIILNFLWFSKFLVLLKLFLEVKRYILFDFYKLSFFIIFILDIVGIYCIGTIKSKILSNSKDYRQNHPLVSFVPIGWPVIVSFIFF